MSLTKSDFGSFFEEIHGHPPFKWQAELAKQVFDHGWPKALKMPTASGKTSVIDIAVFHLALEADSEDRRAPLRIVFVVDRRLVVDDAFEHARTLAKGIYRHDKPVTKKVYDALNVFENLLDVVKLRGGMPQENDWAETPDRPLVITSTVDQVGSRLLFRGYGVSDSMKPVHAGLLGSDVLYILDEADTSKPFLDTLNQISDMRKREWKEWYPFATVFMSATLRYDQVHVFPTREQERLLLDDERISKRITAHKHAMLVPTCSDDQMVEKIVESAIDLSQLSKGKKDKTGTGVRSIGMVVNTVKMAREVFFAIRGQVKKYDNASAHLLTGRIRPLDRDGFVKGKIESIRPDIQDNNGETVFFVATQCIEVGVDIDFDAMVTQIAPLDSLQQRFGRLNRIGSRARSEARIIACKSDTKNDDYIYGDRLANTWKLLNSIAKDRVVDFGIEFLKPELSKLSKKQLDNVISPKPRSVTLMPSYIRAWSQTNPHPYPDPDPSIFLHGRQTKPADVQIVWRADITGKILTDARNSHERIHSVYISPPSALEAVSVPIWTAKRWLTGYGKDPQLGDVEGMKDVTDDQGKKDKDVLLWCGAKDKRTRVIKPADIAPGDTIIVPSDYGGCDTYGWDDSSDIPVDDIGLVANLVHRRQLAIRFDRGVITKMGGDAAWEDFKDIAERHAKDNDATEFIAEIVRSESFPKPWKDILKIIGSDTDRENRAKDRIRIYSTTEDDIPQILGLKKNNLREEQVEKILESLSMQDLTHQKLEKDTEPTTDDDINDAVGSAIGLADHCKGVSKFARRFARNIKMSPDMSHDVEMAALLHDVGKAEKRFQAFLYRMDPDDLLHEKTIAKSSQPIRNYSEYERYRKTSQLPVGHRHECWSVLLAEGYPGFRDSKDLDLVKYLIGTHHGHGRPMFPPVMDDRRLIDVEFELDGKTIHGKIDQELSRLDSGWIDIHHNMYVKYGPWTLAHLEAIVRLADHCQSRMEKNA